MDNSLFNIHIPAVCVSSAAPGKLRLPEREGAGHTVPHHFPQNENPSARKHRTALTDVVDSRDFRHEFGRREFSCCRSEIRDDWFDMEYDGKDTIVLHWRRPTWNSGGTLIFKRRSGGTKWKYWSAGGVG